MRACISGVLCNFIYINRYETGFKKHLHYLGNKDSVIENFEPHDFVLYDIKAVLISITCIETKICNSYLTIAVKYFPLCSEEQLSIKHVNSHHSAILKCSLQFYNF